MTEGALVVAMPGLFTIVEQSEHLYDHVAASWPQPWYGHNLDCAKVLYCNPESAGLGARYSLSAANAIAEGNGERPVGDGDCRCPECRPDLEAARLEARTEADQLAAYRLTARSVSAAVVEDMRRVVPEGHEDDPEYPEGDDEEDDGPLPF